MKARKFQIAVIILTFILAVLFSSGGEALNIKQRSFVHAIGIDSDGDNGYKVTMQVFKPQGAGSDTPVDVIQSNVQIVKCKGKTVNEAILKAQNILGREIFLGHLQLICFGKDVDFSKPEQLFAFCLRDRNVYLGVNLCLAEDKAEDLMNTQITRGTMTSESMKETVEKYIESSRTVNCEIINFLSSIRSHSYIAMPVMSKREPKAKQGEKAEEPEILIDKTALIKNGKVLDDTLDTDEAEAINWFTGKIDKAEYVIKCNNENVNVKVDPDKMMVGFKLRDGKPVVTASFSLNAHVDENIKDENRLNDDIKKRMVDICTAAVEKSLYKNKTDVIGVWKMLRHKYPKIYLKSQDNLEEIFTRTEFEYNIKVKIA